jgi:hypothetical protein
VIFGGDVPMLWDQPHHDGSEPYVPDPPRWLGEQDSVLLRVPRTSDVTSAWLRVLIDGEPELVEATVDRLDDHDTWFRAAFRVVNPVVSYRRLVDGGAYGYQWINGSGIHEHDVADTFDFRQSTSDPPPESATGTVVTNSVLGTPTPIGASLSCGFTSEESIVSYGSRAYSGYDFAVRLGSARIRLGVESEFRWIGG